jgi:hypothetical protein
MSCLSSRFKPGLNVSLIISKKLFGLKVVMSILKAEATEVDVELEQISDEISNLVAFWWRCGFPWQT